MKTSNLLLIGGLVVGAYFLFSKSSPNSTTDIYSGTAGTTTTTPPAPTYTYQMYYSGTGRETVKTLPSGGMLPPGGSKPYKNWGSPTTKVYAGLYDYVNPILSPGYSTQNALKNISGQNPPASAYNSILAQRRPALTMVRALQGVRQW